MIDTISFTSDDGTRIQISIVQTDRGVDFRFLITGPRVGFYTLDLNKDEARIFKDSLFFLFDRGQLK